MKALREHFTSANDHVLSGVFEVTQTVLHAPLRCAELVELLYDGDDSIRHRAGNALEKIAAVRPELVTPFADKLLSDISTINQPAVQWHLAQIFTEIRLTATQAKQAVAILERNMQTTTDWIVQNLTLEALAYFTLRGLLPDERFIEIARRHIDNPNDSVARRANKLVAQFSLG